MANKIKPIQKPRTFWTSVHQNRLKIALSLFVVFIPIALILAVYIGAYTNNRKVHFDEVATPDSVYAKRFVAPDELDAFDLDITWYELKYPVENEDGDLGGGYYKFNIFYTPNENYQVLSVGVTPVLQTPWTDMRSTSPSLALSTSSKQIIISFDYLLPVRPLWFVKVTDPYLYLKVDYIFITAGNQVTKTSYVKLSLVDLNPTRVAP